MRSHCRSSGRFTDSDCTGIHPYVLHKIDEATCETGKGVDDAWNMLKNREGIWQGANIVQTYMSSFEKNIADVIELIDTEDITGYIPAEKTDRA